MQLSTWMKLFLLPITVVWLSDLGRFRECTSDDVIASECIAEFHLSDIDCVLESYASAVCANDNVVSHGYKLGTDIPKT